MVIFLLPNNLLWYISALVYQTHNINFFKMNVRFGGQRNEKQKMPNVVFSSGYYIWHIFHHIPIFDLGTKVCYGLTAMTSRCSTVGACFPLAEHAKTSYIIPRLSRYDWMVLLYFPSFHDSSWPVLRRICLITSSSWTFLGG